MKLFKMKNEAYQSESRKIQFFFYLLKNMIYMIINILSRSVDRFLSKLFEIKCNETKSETK